MKKCPYCAEEIQDEAIKCKHCGEFLNKTPVQAQRKPETKWYFKTSFVIIILVTLGPFGLPLIWFNPNYKNTTKITSTVIILVLSYFLSIMFLKAVNSLTEYYELIFNHGSVSL